MTKKQKSAHIWTTWNKLVREKIILCDKVRTNDWDKDAETMIFIMENVFSTHQEVKQLLKMLKDHKC